MSNNDTNVTEEVMKNVPPVSVSTLTVLGCSLSDMVYIMTIIYILVQIFCIVYKTYKITNKGDIMQ